MVFMAYGDGSLFQTTHNGRAQWAWKWKQEGKYRWAYGDTKREACEARRRREAKIASPDYVEQVKKPARVGTASNPTVKQIFYRWLQAGSRNGKSRSNAQANFDNHLNEIADIPVRKLTPVMVDELFQKLYDSTGGNSVAWHTYKELRAAINWAYKNRLIRNNPMDTTSCPRYINRKSIRLESQIENLEFHQLNLLAWLKDEECSMHEYYPLAVALSLGLRRREVLGLTREALKDDPNRLEVDAQLIRKSGKYYLKPSTKAQAGVIRNREIPLPNFYYEVFMDEANKHPGAGEVNVMIGDEVLEQRHLLFIQDSGKALSEEGIRNLWIRIQETYWSEVWGEHLSKENYISLHTNRHIAASLLALQGESLQTIQTIMGHLTPAMSEHYSHVAGRQLLGVMNKLEATQTQEVREYAMKQLMVDTRLRKQREADSKVDQMNESRAGFDLMQPARGGELTARR